MALPQTYLMGNLVADPVLRFTPAGKAVCSFRVACNENRKNPQTGEWEDGTTTFLGVVVWGQNAELCAEQLFKGAKVSVSGRLKQRDWTTQEGDKRTDYEVDAFEVSLPLRARSAQRSNGASNEVDPWAPAAPAGFVPNDEPPF